MCACLPIWLSACASRSSAGKPNVTVAVAPVDIPPVEKRIRDCLAKNNVDAKKAAALPAGPWTQAQMVGIVTGLALIIDTTAGCGRDLIADADRIRVGLRGKGR